MRNALSHSQSSRFILQQRAPQQSRNSEVTVNAASILVQLRVCFREVGAMSSDASCTVECGARITQPNGYGIIRWPIAMRRVCLTCVDKCPAVFKRMPCRDASRDNGENKLWNRSHTFDARRRSKQTAASALRPRRNVFAPTPPCVACLCSQL